MSDALSGKELATLIQGVFTLRPQDKKLAILVDLPDDQVGDNDFWKERRAIAQGWAAELEKEKEKSSLDLDAVDVIAYPNVHSNNADLPETATISTCDGVNLDSDKLNEAGTPQNFEKLLSDHQIVLALTQFSATAPLKLLAKKHKFRAATMGGFSAGMIPALRLDYGEINRRVDIIKGILDPAIGLKMRFTVDKDQVCDIQFDLRHRTAHASGGRFPKPGTAGNLPSGECYIVPYEGEKKDVSESRGLLPVQFEDEIVIYRIEGNKAVEILSVGKFSEKERDKIKNEPAYANIAEIGFGVLADFGVKPTGVILLDEKLGLHIAFGRSDHFGGAVGVKDFCSPGKVVHIDRIYIPETASRISIEYVDVIAADGRRMNLMSGGMYSIFI